MLLQTWSQVLTASFQGLWLGLIKFLPNILISVVLFVIGWVFGETVGHWVAKLVNALKIDRVLESIGLRELMEKAGYRLNSGKFIGFLIKWFVIVAFLMAALEVLGLNQINIFLQTVVLSYILNVVVSILIFMVGAVLAGALQRIVEASAKAADIKAAAAFGVITKWAVIIFTFVVVIGQLGIKDNYFQILFTGVVAAMAIAVGLAFGLGGKDAAGRLVNKLEDEMKSR
ncbi:MAG: hypothetical protein UV64_C0003G0015 [Parcubacteria group bacterium GW2011_GWC1_43_11b]|uniref:Small-conductance mechanosensitive ion channel n=2 Tax=Candidatus Vogeliibacteriota TaxID=1817922 RepID=A0A1G2QBV3_9BACT|nr:MAG: hypothetical protein UV50_C0003G0015 [Parcubacteria group bacterium GW2011_GWB1_42_9]KKS89617.1 MAG: hypothetical protein UV64_C0003G0015 [Parcubacteria group bacterium GW2011_GWC1_43_11b]KKT10068.1 MAG: hypothetical protein UV88_C0002G0015 [Parcubacteria group bacterium GW2011_GWA1_43_21]OHA58054.1 MAG: hypothetical protein A2370_01680 [Candidatus Vogelbacteria bacterium RIFOXYB1_FULL_42_16]OHA58323.1 MAG: hypothetical protein A2607_00355 [Candidatus Vogelbacteria bacterium RIFOXYD1_FU